MKFTLSWLHTHLDSSASLEEITDCLTVIGLEVEQVIDARQSLAPFRPVRVLDAVPHPDADSLRVCQLHMEGGPVQVVCGAPNARAGMIGVFAGPGDVLPGTGMRLKQTVIRGVQSNGMLCSERELGISDEHDEIIALPEDSLGCDLADVLGMADPLIEIAVTPNRADCLSVHGIARDLAATGIGNLRDKPVLPSPGAFTGERAVSIALPAEEQHLCPAFAWRLIRGVRNGPSPEWMRRRLEAIGLRPINALVDISNFLTFDRGRPLHVFDANKLEGDLAIRKGREGEKLLALDGREYNVDASMVVIADARGVRSLAGVIGGEDSGCDVETVDVLVESALWDPLNIARTGRKLGINSDARHRFERGVDPAFTVPGLELATQLIVEHVGGEASQVELAGSVPERERVITFSASDVKRLTGFSIPDREVKVILTRLGFWAAGMGGADGFKVAVPSWRADVEGRADLVEEVIRIAGLDRVKAEPMSRPAAIARPILTEGQKRRSAARRALAGRGMVEAVTYSFVSHQAALCFGGGSAELQLLNPLSPEFTDMRPSVLPGLIAAAQNNLAHGRRDVSMFEIGPSFSSGMADGQCDVAAGVRCGISPRQWRDRARLDALVVKADALAVLAAVGAPVGNLQLSRDVPSWYHPGRAGRLQLGPKNILAYFGELHPLVLKELGLSGMSFAFEIFLNAVPARRSGQGSARPPLHASDLQPVRRDFAFVVDHSVEAEAVLRAARGADKKLIQSVSLFDLFDGPAAQAALGAGKKSLAIEVTLQPFEQSLSEAQIKSVSEKVVSAVVKASGGQLRNQERTPPISVVR